MLKKALWTSNLRLLSRKRLAKNPEVLYNIVSQEQNPKSKRGGRPTPAQLITVK
jgi:hypothetical protein